MNRIIFAIIGFVTIVLLSSCSAIDESNGTKENETQNIKKLVNDYSVGNIKEQSASITSNQLTVTKNDESKLTYDLPEDEFFVSIAPYVNETHPCEVHSLTGCQGEMVDKEFDVFIEDKDGNVILDETLKSQANGFIDLWVPRDNTYHVAIAYEGKKAEQEISTFEGDNTCVSTMQLM